MNILEIIGIITLTLFILFIITICILLIISKYKYIRIKKRFSNGSIVDIEIGDKKNIKNR